MDSRHGLLLATAAVFLVLTAGGVRAQEISSANVSAFPDGDPLSGRFVNLVRGMESLGEQGTRFYLETEGDLADPGEFVFQIFDGDYGGLWDYRYAPDQGSGASFESGVRTSFFLYADPGHLGADATTGATLVAKWTSDQMSDDAFFTCTSSNSMTGTAVSGTGVANHPDAWDADAGQFHYNLVVEWEDETATFDAMNCFKLLVQGQIFGPALSRFGFVGFKWGAVYYGGGIPWTVDGNGVVATLAQPRTIYSGYWHFHVDVRNPGVEVMDLWNGDFDLRTDTDDPYHSAGVPPWASGGAALPQGARPGSPQDDRTYTDRNGNVQIHPYTFTGDLAEIYHQFRPASGEWSVVDLDPSGNREWESFQIALAGKGYSPDKFVGEFPTGHYHWEMFGVDAQNSLFIRPEYDLYTEFGNHDLGDRVWLDQDNSGGPDDLSEPGINGATVSLYLRIGDQWLFYGSQETRTATIPDPADAAQTIEVDGYYLFEDLASGDYRVEIDASTLPATLVPTYDLDGISTPHVAALAVGGNQDNYEVDFGYVSRESGTGTGTIGYWKNHPEAWPVPTIRIGGEIWSRAAAIERMTGYKRSKGKEDDLFAQLVAAKLNVMTGNDDSCIAADIQAADEWLEVYDGQVVSARSAAWKLIEASFENLDDYNNGRLPCAGHRD